MPTTARVARIHEYGPPEVLRFEDIVVGEPGDDEALIRNTVIGLNFVDVYYRRGTLPVPAFPAIIGDEAAGVVEAVGKNVKNVGSAATLIPFSAKPSAYSDTPSFSSQSAICCIAALPTRTRASGSLSDKFSAQ